MQLLFNKGMLMASFNDGVGPGLFLPTTEIFDVNIVQDDAQLKEKLREVFIRIVQSVSNTNSTVNYKDSAIYPLTEFVNGQKFFSTAAGTGSSSTELRQVFRKVINFGSLPNAGTKSIAHGITITANTTFTRIYGAASDTTGNNYIPLPYVNVSGTLVAGNIELRVDGTHVRITTTGNGSNFNICYVILEYLKN
jgi:hypothetical protein